MNSKLCGLPRVNQAEAKEENSDEYIFCSRCCFNVYEYCSIHGPLLVIPDDEVPKQCNLPLRIPKAAFTIPSKFLHLAPSAISDSGVGVFATWPLPAGVRFGPYRGRITRGIGSQYCWQIHSRVGPAYAVDAADDDHANWMRYVNCSRNWQQQNLLAYQYRGQIYYRSNVQPRRVYPIHSRVGPAYAVDAADDDHANWMRYVNCSRNWQQQNLLAYQYRGQIYYRTIKTIPRFGELLVFYGSEFAWSLNIDLTIYNSNKPGYDDADKSKAAMDGTRAKCQKTALFTENKPEIFDKFGYNNLQAVDLKCTSSDNCTDSWTPPRGVG
ncbi:unnamed protein product, partial [Iphiclides podalirius]